MITITLTEEQEHTFTTLRETTITGKTKDQPKTVEELGYQVLESGMRALLQQRKQYARTREALRQYSQK